MKSSTNGSQPDQLQTIAGRPIRLKRAYLMHRRSRVMQRDMYFNLICITLIGLMVAFWFFLPVSLVILNWGF